MLTIYNIQLYILDDVKKMAYLKSKTPFIMYFNGFSYEEWETYLSYEKQFSFYIKEHNLDGIIFDKMYRVSVS